MSRDQIDSLLKDAKRAIADGEASLQKAAECIAQAQGEGATQREIAEAVGKSPAWVNQLLKWRSGGYEGSAFGSAKAQQRATFRQSEQKEKSRPVTTDEQARVGQARAEAEAEGARERAAKAEAERAKHERKKAEANARRAREEARRARERASWGRWTSGAAEIHSSSRTLLVKALGMLGSDHDDEILAAARTAEQQRRKLNLTWDELIVEAAAEARRAA
jgi:hypothetical protein